jgi:dipeptidyl-peptidase-4
MDQKRFTPILTIEDNSELARKLIYFALPSKQFTTVAAKDGTRLFMSYMLPHQPSAGVFYPAMFDIYGGPGSQTVTREWTFGFDELLASNNIIVAKVDPRGTGKRGLDFMYQVYGILGQKEVEDVIAVVTQFSNNPYIDYGRIGIWGWSYGGYMALNTICRGGSAVFQLAISVAPVTDWLYYDTFYTERYMNQPKYNPQGYNAGSVVESADKLENFPFLLVHGTGDDNVHFQNTAILNEKLIELGIQYETMFYTNRQHSISGDGARPHLYTLLYNFIINNLVSLPEVRQQIFNN